MASTITAQTLTVTISEAITLNDVAINSSNILSVPSINEISKRIMTVPSASEKSLLAFGTAVAAGTYIRADVKYIRITNKDSANFVRIRVTKTGADTFDTKLEPGKSFMMGNTKESVSATGVAFSAFQDIDFISGQADTADVDVEIFIAST